MHLTSASGLSHSSDDVAMENAFENENGREKRSAERRTNWKCALQRVQR